MKEPGDQLHAANKIRWDAAATNWARSADSRGLWRRCPTEPELVLGAQELRYLADVAGKRVCVLGSGDNQVVFALAVSVQPSRRSIFRRTSCTLQNEERPSWGSPSTSCRPT